MKTIVRNGRRAAAALALLLASASAQGQSDATERVALPGIGYEVVLEPQTSQELTQPDPALIDAIGAWLSFSLDLPTISQPPAFRFVAPEAIAELRNRGAASGHKADVTIGSSATGTAEMGDVLAFYDDQSRTIYLREDWSGNTAAGLSIVVHEIVHHVQNLAGLRFECHEAREKQAFSAQEQWLALFGKDLATEFGLDPLTLLVRTNCSF